MEDLGLFERWLGFVLVHGLPLRVDGDAVPPAGV